MRCLVSCEDTAEIMAVFSCQRDALRDGTGMKTSDDPCRIPANLFCPFLNLSRPSPSTSGSTGNRVRFVIMKPFFKLMSREKLQELVKAFPPLMPVSTGLEEALGLVTAQDYHAPEDLPPFARSTMDGYAIRSRDTFGASESQPALFQVIGEVAMGISPAGMAIGRGEAARIWTGGELPDGADAVVMVEYTNVLSEDTIEVFKAIAPGGNVIEKGEDVEQGTLILSKGTRLRAQDLGLMAGLGISKIKAHPRPRVAIISTGDELVPPDGPVPRGKIRDINATTLAAAVKNTGGVSYYLGIVRDKKGNLAGICKKALASDADVILVSGGSSVGQRDFTLETFSHIEGSRLLTHGVSVRPGKPTIIAEVGGKALVGLPGHAASAMVVFYLFVYPLLRRMMGFVSDDDLYLKKTRAAISRNIASSPGKEEYLRIRIKKTDNGPLAEPVFGKSGLITPLVKADGLLVIPRDSEGIYAGEEADVLLFP